MKIEKVNMMGMPLESWTHKSTTANFGVGDDFATLYNINSNEKNKGHATELLVEAKKHYENLGKNFGGTIALSPAMAHIYKKLNIVEYKD